MDCVGQLPIRPGHVNTKVAIDGSDAANDVQGWYSDVNPVINPARLRVRRQQRPPALRQRGLSQSTTTRATPAHRGIMDALSIEKNDWTVTDAQALQLDHHSPVYRKNAAKMVALAKQGGADADAAVHGLVGRRSFGLRRRADVNCGHYRWMCTAPSKGPCTMSLSKRPRTATPRTSLKLGTRPLSRRTASCMLAAMNEKIGWWTSAQTAWRPPRTWWRRPRRRPGGPRQSIGREPRPMEVRAFYTKVHRHAMTDALGWWAIS